MTLTKTERRHSYVYPEPAPAEYHACLACIDVRARYRESPRNLHFFGWKLLQQNWLGSTDSVEKAYRRKHGGFARLCGEAFVREAPFPPLT